MIAQGLLPIAALFNPKIKKFHNGRKEVFKQLKKELHPNKKTIWLHAASLGEYEQGVPVLEALRQAYPKSQILLSFFSPSGYEVRKNSALADCVCYLPIDSFKNARRFVQQVKPSMALFVKYEVWPNYMLALAEAEIPSILFSGIFRPSQIYFKWYGGFMRESLHRFSKIFVQDQASLDLLGAVGVSEIALTGDTRFDRVFTLSQQAPKLPSATEKVITRFLGETPCLVGGSIWPEDMAVLSPAFSQHSQNLKYIIAPHLVDHTHIKELLSLLSPEMQSKSLLLSKAVASQPNSDTLASAQLLIVDSIGLLNSLYPLAQMAYVGGGFKTGLHNTLEAAVYGIPLAIGPQYKKFKEAKELVGLGGITVIQNAKEGIDFLQLGQSISHRNKVKEIQKKYMTQHLGSSQKIMEYVGHILSPDFS